MAIQRLVLDSIEEDEYELIAIHCSLEPYRLAYLLNKNLQLQLFRTKEDLYFEYHEFKANFPLYQYDDAYQYSYYSLCKNKCKREIQQEIVDNDSLFPQTAVINTTKYIIPELKNVDYFLKIETETYNYPIRKILADMLAISQIITAYGVDYSQLKSKNNLIFE